MKGSVQDNYNLAIDVEMPGDQLVKYRGSKVLLVDKELSHQLDGSVLDIEENTQGKNFVVLERK